MTIVSNAGPILSFARAGRLDLLQGVLSELTIPDAAYEEIVSAGSGKPGALQVKQASWIKRASIKDRSFVEQLPKKLHLGEREAIALAKELDAFLLIDEREARKEALQLGVDYFGSLRVLKDAKDRGFIREIKPILDELVAAGTYVSDELYHKFLRDVGEEQASP